MLNSGVCQSTNSASMLDYTFRTDLISETRSDHCVYIYKMLVQPMLEAGGKGWERQCHQGICTGTCAEPHVGSREPGESMSKPLKHPASQLQRNTRIG